MVRSGISFKINETSIELLWQDSNSEENKSSTTISFCPDDLDDELGYSNCSHSHYAEDIFGSNEDISDKNQHGKRRVAGEGSDENDSLLVAYDADSVVSLWHKNIIICRLSRLIKFVQ